MLSPQEHPSPDIETILAAKGLDGGSTHCQEQLAKLGKHDVEYALSEPMQSVRALFIARAKDDACLLFFETGISSSYR